MWPLPRNQFTLLLAFLTVTTAFAAIAVPAQASDFSAGADSQHDTEAPAEADNGLSYFVSPITALRYQISYDAELGQNVYVLDDRTYTSLDSIMEYEVSLYPDGLYKIEPSLRVSDAQGEPDGRVPIMIFLSPKFGREVALRVRQSYETRLESLWTQRQELLDRIMATKILGPLPADSGSVDPVLDARFKSVDSEYSMEIAQMRRLIFAETEELNAPSQDVLASRIAELSGVVGYRGQFVNVLGARISPEGLRELVKDSLVESVHRNVIMTAKLDISVPSIEAPQWWAAGYNTATYKLVNADTGVNSTHPALVGKITDAKVFHDDGKNDPSYDDDPTTVEDLHGHGTHIAGIMASQDAARKGVAYGLKGIINAKWGYQTTDLQGSGQWTDCMRALDWAIGTAGGSVISFSFGDSTLGDGNSGPTKFVDAIVDDLGISFSVAAGNAGPGRVGRPADSFNALVVGAMDDAGTTDRGNDFIASFSSRGPTGDNRIKPDITAPGMDSTNPNGGIYSTNYKWETQSDWVDYAGTSMAAPHIGASLILLLNYLGPRGFFPAIPKALLLENAQDKGGIGPDNTYGWGYVALNQTLQNKDKVYNSTVTRAEPAFYVGTWAGGDRATLVWQRHVTYRGAAYPTTFYTLNNLDLFLYNGQTNALATSSTSTVDDVEQARSGFAVTTAVLKVKAMASLNGVTAEPFAIATLKPFTLVRRPTFQITWQGPTTVEGGTIFSLTANVTNVGDLTAFGTSISMTPPAGLTYLAGANPASLGDIPAGQTRSASWTFRGDTTGDHPVNVTVTSNSFGETLTATSSRIVRVMDSVPPVVNGVWAQPSPQNAGLNVNITADITDNLAVTAAYAYVTGPTGPLGNFSMAKHPLSGLWFVDRPYYVRGNYLVDVWGTDIDYWAWGPTAFTIVDTTPPSIITHGPQPGVQQIHGRVNVTANVWDQAGIAGSWIEITDPYIVKTNYSMGSSGNNYWFEQQYDVLGLYSYRISVVDPSDLWNVGTGSFTIVDTIRPAISGLDAQPNPQLVFGSVNITATITDVGGVVDARVEITDPQSGKTNLTLDKFGDSYWHEQTYGLLGTYSYVVSAVDIVGNCGVATGTFRIVDTVFPVADAGSDLIVPWATVVTFDASGSSDNFGISSYVWTFNDQGPETLTGVSPSYQFMRIGFFIVTLKVEDYSGNNATDTMTVKVEDRTRPEISPPLASPNPQNLNGAVEVRAAITDNVGVAGVWLMVRDPFTFRTNSSMSNVAGDDYSLTANYFIEGTYYFEIWAVDTSSNWNNTSGTFEIRDIERPALLAVDATPDPQEVLYSIQIGARVTDNVGVAGVWAQVARPGGQVAGNFSMSFDAGLGRYRVAYPTDALGMHTYRVSASDMKGNWNFSGGQFLVRDTTRPTIQPTNSFVTWGVDTKLNFTALANDNFRVESAYADVQTPQGDALGNLTMSFAVSVGSNYYFILNCTILGDYQVRLSVRDFGGNWGTSSATVNVVDRVSPVADAGNDQTVTEDDLVRFDGSGSSDNHGIASYTWTFIENQQQVTLLGVRPSYTFAKPGNYRVTLTVEDYGGNTGSDEMNLRVNAESTGNQPKEPKARGIIDIIVEDILVGRFWLVLFLVVVVTMLVVAVAGWRRARRKRARLAAARARREARAKAAREELPPPPEDEEEAPPEAETEEASGPPPPEDEAEQPESEEESARRPPPPLDDEMRPPPPPEE